MMKGERRSEAIWIESKKYWQIKVQKDGVRKGFTSSTPGRRGKHEAENKADEWLERGTSDMRFPQAWEIYIQDQKKRTGTSNVKKLEQYYRLYIAPGIGVRKLSGINPNHWQACIDAAAQKGLSVRTCGNIRATIMSFVSYAMRSRWEIQRIEARELVIPQSAAPIKGKTVLQPDEIRMLFSDPNYIYYGKPHEAHYIHAWRFMVVTGLRRGELCGLQKDDISGNLLSVRRSINNENEITSGKNRNARRTIELTPIALRVLSDQADMLKRKGIISHWVFPDKSGAMPIPNNVYDLWATWRKQHGIKSSLHELRHTFISINKADLPLELMKSVVGHSSSMDTFGVYGHEIDGDRHRAAQIINGVFESVLKSPSSANNFPPTFPPV